MFFIRDPQRRLLFGVSFKAGCTHILHMLYYCLYNKECTVPIHHPELWPDQTWDLPPDIDTYDVFVFVRNPYDRLVSGYLDKYSPKETKSKGFREQWFTHLIQPLTFRNFLRQLVTREWTAVEYTHFCPQTEHLCDERLLESAKSIHVFDLYTFPYSLLERCYQVRLPTKLTSFRGPHCRSKGCQILDHVYDQDRDDIQDDVLTSSHLFFPPDLKDLFDEFFAYDFYFCQKYGIKYNLSS